MTVYVGGAHMLTSDLQELHELAAGIGLERAWFRQDGAFPRYDLTASDRAQAIAAGAVQINVRQLPGDVLVHVRGGGYGPYAGATRMRVLP